MDIEKYNEAVKIKDEIDDLESELKSLKAGQCNDIKIELKTGYSDMGRDFTTTARFKGDTAAEIYMAISDIIKRRIAQLEQQFDEL